MEMFSVNTTTQRERVWQCTCLTLVILLCPLPMSSGTLINGRLLGGILDDIADNGLGVSDVQAEYDALEYTNSPLDGAGISKQLANSISAQIQGAEAALKGLVNVIEEQYSSFSGENQYTQCCEVTNTNDDPRYKSEVNFDKACVAEAGQSSVNKKFPTARIVEVMKENVRINPNLKWQYFGGEDGILLNYPAVKPTGVPDCDSYDPRFRSFYASAVSPVPKDVVLVLDTSDSMRTLHNGKTLMELAKQAARTVLDSLGPNDQIGLVSLASSASTPVLAESTCYTTTLAAATPSNIQNLKKYLDSLRAMGGRNYEAGLKKAFSFFRSSNGTVRDQVVLFLAAGGSSEGSDPVSTIRDENAALEEKVLVLTFGLGKSVTGSVQTTLQNMAAQTQSRMSAGEVKMGTFTKVENPDDLSVAMATYYKFFLSPSQGVSNPEISAPHRDILDKGLITSICLPAYHSGRLIGVACSDVAMSELLSEATYFDKGELSYAFVINGYGRTYSHPLLPRPYDDPDDPIFVDIHHLERAPAAKSVISSMIRGEEGNSSFVSTRTQARGDVFREGVSITNVMSHYYWAPVAGSTWSVCVVISDGSKNTEISPPTVLPSIFRYHRLDLKSASIPCKHFFKYATKDTTSVMLTPGAFRQPYHYLNTEETATNVTQYERYLTGQSSQNPGFKNSVLGSVAATYKAEVIWRKKHADYITWRSIGTMDGVVRVFPGTQLAKSYDHTRTDWFQRSLVDKGKNVVSAPYLDPWGSGYMITLSRTLYEAKADRQHTPSDNIVAVMKADFTLYYLYQAIQDNYTYCSLSSYRCFVIDSSGYLVVHDSFVEVSDSPNIEKVHIFSKEPAIGRDLVAKGVLVRESCIEYKKEREHFYWKVIAVPGSGIDNMAVGLQYELHSVSNSNVYLVITRRKLNTTPCKCTSDSPSYDSQCGALARECECPCYKNSSDYNSCRLEFSTPENMTVPCPQALPNIPHLVHGESSRIKSLSNCKALSCHLNSTQRGCFSVVGCSWCRQSKSGKELNAYYCAKQLDCYFGRVGQKCPYDTCGSSNVDNGGDDLNEVGLMIGFAVFGVVFLYIISKKFREKVHRCRNNVLEHRCRLPRCNCPKPQIPSIFQDCCQKSTNADEAPSSSNTQVSTISNNMVSSSDSDSDAVSQVVNNDPDPPPPVTVTFANSVFDSEPPPPTAPPPAYEDVVPVAYEDVAPAPPPSYDRIMMYMVRNNDTDSQT
ncbi:VWFA and cache domain-containing protein 1 [Lingula anatina]|uniref:VWFA and cache domain-containing protein 1 n=1 Tax=Lingula anatina TaxID=7574 RepID=A0A1S3KE35_LINAN|nr:VWFA and cache domain-containing protein 1 [Lingula anatina]|eukprot:XP_013420890.1 VWFA and cache domain-containing protein 1 [Lingula anatina]